MSHDTFNALEQALTAMPHQDLVRLILQLSQEQVDFRRILLAHFNISFNISSQPSQPQSTNSQLVKQLKRDISNFFNELQDGANYYDYYYDREYDEDEEYSELAVILENAQTLSFLDQASVFWHIVICGETMFEQEEYIIGTPQIEAAISLYSQAVSQLELAYKDKYPYFGSLIDALSWNMCNYGNISDAIENSLEFICRFPEDYRCLIEKFQESDYDKKDDLIAKYYLKLGEDENYLKTRQANLQREGQYLELAQYWQQKGDEEQYIATLEKWVTNLSTNQSQPTYLPYLPSVASSPILQILAEHYQHQQDDENLCRIFMTMAEYGQTTLALYKQIEAVAVKLGTWETLRPRVINFTKQDKTTRAEIYLSEQDWDAAIEVADLGGDVSYNESLKVLVAEGVKEHRPKVSIQLYQQLVQSHIDRKNREHYRIAARHASAIKSIYLSILNDVAAWQDYMNNLRQSYPRHRALQEELKGL